MSDNSIPGPVRRQQATELVRQRYFGLRVDYKERVHCVAMVLDHLRAMGHRVPKCPPVRGPLAARKALLKRGWKNLAEMMDSLGFERIPPAAMRLGDVAFRREIIEGCAQTEEAGTAGVDIGGLMICVSAHKLMSWFANPETQGRLVVMDMSFDQVDAAWRI